MTGVQLELDRFLLERVWLLREMTGIRSGGGHRFLKSFPVFLGESWTAFLLEFETGFYDRFLPEFDWSLKGN